jgi:hypothetical protein
MDTYTNPFVFGVEAGGTTNIQKGNEANGVSV